MLVSGIENISGQEKKEIRMNQYFFVLFITLLAMQTPALAISPKQLLRELPDIVSPTDGANITKMRDAGSEVFRKFKNRANRQDSHRVYSYGEQRMNILDTESAGKFATIESLSTVSDLSLIHI